MTGDGPPDWATSTFRFMRLLYHGRSRPEIDAGAPQLSETEYQQAFEPVTGTFQVVGGQRDSHAFTFRKSFGDTIRMPLNIPRFNKC